MKYLRVLTCLFPLFLFCASISTGQELLLRHQFQPGQSAQAMTDVMMNGDSFITGTKAATNLRMKMLRELRVQSIDPQGNATMSVTVQRIQTNGKMNESKFNKDLSGDQLQEVMFGGTEMTINVSPMGHVQGGNENPLQKLGISLPTELPGTGGFECPTFPFNPVRVGVSWTENGEILPRNSMNRNPLSGTQVYQLQRVYQTPKGRMAVIRYRKTTDLSGMSLLGGGSAPALGGLSGGGASIQAGGLVIQLEGEIEFNIDQGVVTRSTQQGLWNLNMNLPSVAGKKNVPVNQRGMKIRIQTNMQWKGLKNMSEPPKLPRIKRIPIKPPMELLPPDNETESKEIP